MYRFRKYKLTLEQILTAQNIELSINRLKNNIKG